MPLEQFRLDGKVALITGAARGQGEAEARLFTEAGACVVLADVLDELGEAVAADIGDSARYVHHDVRDEASWAQAVGVATDTFGRLDVLVNNAGILKTNRIENQTLDDFDAIVRVNLYGVFNGMRAAIAPMRASGGGSIVNISSAAGLRGVPGYGAYGATKWAVRGITKTAALELAADRIRVELRAPRRGRHADGRGVEPAARRGRASRRAARSRRRSPKTSPTSCSSSRPDASSYITGAEFAIDGGGFQG